MMILQELQQKVDRWIQTHGVRYFQIMTNTALLNEEVGELSGLLARVYGEQSFKGDQPVKPQEHVADEMADVLFVLVCMANQLGIDLSESVEKNLEKKTKRDIQRHKNNPKLRD